MRVELAHVYFWGTLHERGALGIIRPHVPALPGKPPSHSLLHAVIQFAAQRCLCCRVPRLDSSSGHVVLREKFPSNGRAVCRWEIGLQPVPAPKVAPPQIAVIWGVYGLQVPGASNATPATRYQLRYLPTSHTNCSELWGWLCAGLGTHGSSHG
jgi:hypothetical protein